MGKVKAIILTALTLGLYNADAGLCLDGESDKGTAEVGLGIAGGGIFGALAAWGIGKVFGKKDNTMTVLQPSLTENLDHAIADVHAYEAEQKANKALRKELSLRERFLSMFASENPEAVVEDTPAETGKGKKR